MTNESDIVIIGAGPTGLGAAFRLNELGNNNWTLIEAEDGGGGLAGSVIDDKGFTWDLGGHVLFSHYTYFDNLMEDLLGQDWVDHVREAWVWMREKFIPYPMQNNIRHLPPDELEKCLAGLREVADKQKDDERPKDFLGWILKNFGQGLADAFLIPYNKKVWAYDPSRLSVGWMGERVAQIDLDRILKNIAEQKDDCGWGPNSTFRFPLRGGTGAIWQALVDRLPKERLSFGQAVELVDPEAKTVTLKGGRTLPYDHLISSMPLDLLVKKIKNRPDLAEKADKFVYSSVHVIGIGFDGVLPSRLQKKCWMYFPESHIPPYRVTVFSNYSPNNVPEPDKQWSLLCEVSESPDKPVNADTIAEEVRRALTEAGLIPENEQVVSLWHKRLEHGYPTPFIGRDELLEGIQSQLESMNIFSRGRFGGWKYEVSNQDHSLMQGKEVVDRLLNGEEEMTYLHPDVVNSRKN